MPAACERELQQVVPPHSLLAQCRPRSRREVLHAEFSARGEHAVPEGLRVAALGVADERGRSSRRVCGKRECKAVREIGLTLRNVRHIGRKDQSRPVALWEQSGGQRRAPPLERHEGDAAWIGAALGKAAAALRSEAAEAALSARDRLAATFLAARSSTFSEPSVKVTGSP